MNEDDFTALDLAIARHIAAFGLPGIAAGNEGEDSS
jgi:hypothetical protein